MRFSVLTKLAVICNVCFLLAIFLQQHNFINNEEAKSYIIILGYLLSFVVNFAAIVWWVALIYTKKLNSLFVLPVINSLFFILQLYLFFK
jgi:uncharacterized membrane protein